MNKKVVVGMSGGVDSSVCVHLLKEQGYDVIGVTMQVMQKTSEVEDAKRVAKQLGVQHYVVDFRKNFKKYVINYFIDEYKHGRTPNPCVVCNKYVKWEALLSWAKEMGADMVATGHYASIEKLQNGRYTVKTCVSKAKDQTYVLYGLTQEQLKSTMMPLGSYSKDEIREIANSLNLEVANKPDSMENCFIPDNDYVNYIEKNSDYRSKEGNFVNLDGEVLGKHSGIIHYTIGQRKGLNIAFGKPMYVIKIDVERNEVVLGDNEDVFGNVLYCNKINMMSIEKLDGKVEVMAKIRYNHKGDMCSIEQVDDDLIKCTFDKPQRAITPGQAVVFYKDDCLLGGGRIL